MADGFYGGRPGYSFIIVANYASIDEMVENFQQGPSYEAVHFDEHVLINTENKNDPDNGKIYRRSYDYTNDLGGAVYIGTIVGPAGKAPLLELTTIADVQSKQAEEGYDYRYSEGSYAPTENLVPGYDGNETYIDEIEWACCSIRNENEDDCIAYIGFKVPYLVADFEAESVSAYYNRSDDTNDFINEDLAERVDDGDHPFYEKWHFNIPKGIKGDSLNNFRVMVADDTIEEYDGQQDDIDNNREVLVYDYYNYDNNETGDPVSLYLGDYNMIDDITFDEEGTIVISYSHDDDVTYSKLLKWIDSVTLSADGRFVVTYNQTDDSGNAIIYETQLSWVSDITLAEDGTVTITYSDGNTASLSEKLKWITSISIQDDGTFVVTYNDSSTTELTKVIKCISNITIETADDSGEEGTGDQKIHVTYNTGEEEIIGESLNYIIKMAMVEDDYHLLVYYSDPAKRQEIIAAGENYTYDGSDEWFDLGSVKDDSGILIGLNLTATDENGLSNTTTAITYLNSTYPNGLEGTDLQGKVVTIGAEDGNKQFYAFDYSADSWYYLGSFDISVSNLVMIGAETDTDIESKQSVLDIGGLWFVVED